MRITARIIAYLLNMVAASSLPLRSIKQAVGQQGLSGLYQRLREIVPDITHQYVTFDLNTEYLVTDVRAVHAFQILLVQQVIRNGDSVLDIGDSSGTHISYIKALYPGCHVAGANIDREAVSRIRRRGLEAIQIGEKSLPESDLLLCFETLEHVVSPIDFLSGLPKCRNLVITVPFVRRSRVKANGRNPETTHIFELSPQDWCKVFNYAGWRIVTESTYLQYAHWWMKYYWRKMDFEGFYGVILEGLK